MTTVLELRKLSLDARRENSNERHERYSKARDEAFEILTDGVMDKIKNAAKEGRFRYPIYRWTNVSKHVSEQVAEHIVDDAETNGIPEATQLTFGNDESGKNGLHIMALVQPTGIGYDETLMARLRDYFNQHVAPADEGNSADGQSRRNQLRVYFQRHPTNPRQCAIFVSWDRHQAHQMPPRRVYAPRPQTSPSKGQDGERVNTFGGLRTPFRGAGTAGPAPVRGGSVFRGAPRGRGRMTAPRQ